MLVPAFVRRGRQNQLEMKTVTAAAFSCNYSSKNWCWRDVWLIVHKLVLRPLRIPSTARVEILKINRHERKPFSYVACSVIVDAQNQWKNYLIKVTWRTEQKRSHHRSRVLWSQTKSWKRSVSVVSLGDAQQELGGLWDFGVKITQMEVEAATSVLGFAPSPPCSLYTLTSFA